MLEIAMNDESKIDRIPMILLDMKQELLTKDHFIKDTNILRIFFMSKLIAIELNGWQMNTVDSEW